MHASPKLWPRPAAGSVGPNFISPLQVGLGAVLVLVNACISVYLELGLEVALAIATVRCDPRAHMTEPATRMMSRKA